MARPNKPWFRDRKNTWYSTIDGKKVTSADDLQNALQDKKPGDTVQVEVLRDSDHATIPVRLSERPPQER